MFFKFNTTLSALVCAQHRPSCVVVTSTISGSELLSIFPLPPRSTTQINLLGVELPVHAHSAPSSASKMDLRTPHLRPLSKLVGIVRTFRVPVPLPFSLFPNSSAGPVFACFPSMPWSSVLCPLSWARKHRKLHLHFHVKIMCRVAYAVQGITY